MARQSRRIGTPAKISGARSARALGILERLASIGRENVRIARATTQVRTLAGHRLRVPASVSFPEYRRLAEAASHSTKSANSVNGLHRTGATFDGGDHLQRGIQEFAPAMDALSRVERNSNVAPQAIRPDMKTARDFAERSHRAIQGAKKMVVASMESSQGSDAQVSNRSRDGLVASARTASSIREVIPIRNLSQREFAESAGNARARDGGGADAGITVHSSPTVVINESVAGGGLARDAIGALSAHRDELFNQLRRESVRRERAQF